MSLITSSVSTLKNRGPQVLFVAIFRHILGVMLALMKVRFFRKKIYNFYMWLDLKDAGISRTLWLFGERELEHRKILESILKPGMTILDIGANIGYYVLLELQLMKNQGFVIAVEPSPQNVDLLKRNLRTNGHDDVEVHECAVSYESGQASFHLSEMSNLNTFHDNGTGSLHLSGRTILVKTKTVPQILNGRQVNLIRMDVEGHEVAVLNGLLPEIEAGHYQPMVLFETHLSRYSAENDIEKPLRRMFAQGYTAKIVGSSSERGSDQLRALGYNASQYLRSDGDVRGIFFDITNEDVIRLVCKEGGIRTLLLCKN